MSSASFPIRTMVLFLFFGAWFLAPFALAGPSARVEPSVAAPGQVLWMTFSVPAPEQAEAVVSERVVCTIAPPSGAPMTACDRAGSLVEARLVGGGVREYLFNYPAPATLGTHGVHFERQATLMVPTAAQTADATFKIVEAGSPELPPNPPGGNSPTGPPSDGTSPTPPANPPGEPGDGGGSVGDRGTDQAPADLARWTLSTLAGGAVTTVTLLSRRWRLGNLP